MNRYRFNRCIRFFSLIVSVASLVGSAWAGPGVSFDTPPSGSSFDVGTVVNPSGVGPGGIDIILVLDESGSVSPSEFALEKQAALDFVNAFTFGPGAVKMGVALFATDGRLALSLNGNKATVRNVIQALANRGGRSCSACGLQVASDNLESLGRATAEKIIILITDGSNSEGSPDAATFLNNVLSTIASRSQIAFAVGVGVGVPPGEIDLIATDLPVEQTAYMVSSFSGLGIVITAIASTLAGLSIDTVDLTLPNSSSVTVAVDGSGRFTVPDWSMTAGDNVFIASISTLYGEVQDSLTLVGTDPVATSPTTWGAVKDTYRGGD